MLRSHTHRHSIIQRFSRQNVNSAWSRRPLPITTRNAKRARLAAFDKIRNVVPLTYTQMIAQQRRQLNIYRCYLYFAKTGHEFIVVFSNRASVLKQPTTIMLIRLHKCAC